MISIGVPDPIHVGKVRESYDADQDLMLVRASDRISIFDVVLPTLIPGKGKVLTALTDFWLTHLLNDIPHHLVSTHPSQFPVWAENNGEFLDRSMLVRRANMLPLECIVRGYLYGSVMREYEARNTASGVKLPGGLVKASQLPEPIFTPSTKAVEGHDENITVEQAAKLVPPKLLERVRLLSLEVYRRAASHAYARGIIVADTKFELGINVETGELMLCDEVLTPDSSRFWELASWEPGQEPVSYDKQFARNYGQKLCDEGKWDKKDPGPELPDDIVVGTQEKYGEVLEVLTRI